MTTTIALFGAGGTMGTRISNNLSEADQYEVIFVESGEKGVEVVEERGDTVTPMAEATQQSDIVILAVPDHLIGDVCGEIVPKVSPGTMIFVLDPAAAYAGELPERESVSYFVTHPCHPHLFQQSGGDVTDWFGGQGELEQSIVCALHQGTNEDLEQGKELARHVFAPVSTVHEISVEEMAILEPALVENVLTPCIIAIYEAYERTLEHGVPRDATEDMLFGHMRTQIAMIFGWLDHPLSHGAETAVKQGEAAMLKENWMDLMDKATIQTNVSEITQK